MINLNKEQRTDVSKAFLAAKKFLWDGENGYPRHLSRFICHALADSRYDGKISLATYNMAVIIIGERIGHTATICGWLYGQGVTDGLDDNILLQTYRHTWLDKLSEEFSH